MTPASVLSDDLLTILVGLWPALAAMVAVLITLLIFDNYLQTSSAIEREREHAGATAAGATDCRTSHDPVDVLTIRRDERDAKRRRVLDSCARLDARHCTGGRHAS